KDLAAVAPHPLENAIAIEQAVVVHADLGVFFVVVLARDIDLQAHAFGGEAGCCWTCELRPDTGGAADRKHGLSPFGGEFSNQTRKSRGGFGSRLAGPIGPAPPPTGASYATDDEATTYGNLPDNALPRPRRREFRPEIPPIPLSAQPHAKP